MPKSAITYLLNEETIKQFTTHDSIEALNATYWKQINANSADLTKTEREIYFKLTQYAAKYPGAAYLTANTMATLIDKSRSTVMRAYRRLKVLNMIEVIPCKRKSDNRQTASVIRIMPLNVEVTAKNARGLKTDTDVPVAEDSAEKPVSNQAKSSVESNVDLENATQDATQGNGQNDTPLNSLSLNSLKALNLKTLDTGECNALEVLNAFNIDQSLIRAIQPMALSTSKQVELLNGGIATHLQNALSRKFPAFMRNFDILSHLDAIQSAAIRTAFVSKRKQVHNIVGYFLRTLVALISESFAELAADIAIEAAEVEGYVGYDAVVYAKHEAKGWAQYSALERVTALINEHYGITNQTTEVIA
ncbi:hypothetical protein [Exiguobacterium sp. ZWU0009]|uniref:hypothetical protein n=1 Tax=Exiguobacterium sp. ZWU0009 TaxID=1224749 RepID=UPI000691DFF3|nr:hypothetical protein [Exiguobacterium sp. ZWU0009]